MKARDVKCPKCGEGLRDVAPNYEFRSPRRDEFPALANYTEMFCHCRGGHKLVWSMTPGGFGKEANDAFGVSLLPEGGRP